MKPIIVPFLALALAACSQTTAPGDADNQAAAPTPASPRTDAPTATEPTAPAATPAAKPTAVDLQPAEGQAKLALAIEGLHCTGCAAGVDRRLRAVDGVADCTVDFESGRAVVVYDPAQTDAATLADASIAGTDYTAAPLTE